MFKHIFHILVICFILASSSLPGQTKVNLQYQTVNPDFSATLGARPMSVGSEIPLTCRVGEVFFNSSAVAGSNLYLCTSVGIWTVQSDPMSELRVSRTGTQTLEIGTGCTLTSPCRVRFGALVRTLSRSAIVTLTGGSGNAYFYVSSDGIVNAGSDGLTISCNEGCIVSPAQTTFPADAVPIFSWTASSGEWSAGGNDARTSLSTVTVDAGFGLNGTTVDGRLILSVNSSILGLRVSPPVAATDACTIGHWAVNESHFFTCVTTNVWKRMEITTW